jgi:hypothetical protein
LVPEFHQHLDPIDRANANFLIQAPIETDENEVERFEQLWVRKLGDRRFKVCCIPFFVYDLALGDEVGTDDDLIFKEVLVRSGAWTLRVWFGEANLDEENKSKLVEEVDSLGAVSEVSSANLIAFSVPDDETAARVRSRLETEEAAGRLTYETGWR